METEQPEEKRLGVEVWRRCDDALALTAAVAVHQDLVQLILDLGQLVSRESEPLLGWQRLLLSRAPPLPLG